VDDAIQVISVQYAQGIIIIIIRSPIGVTQASSGTRGTYL